MKISTIKRLRRSDSILRLLCAKPQSMYELAEAQGTVPSNIWAYLNRMRKAKPKLVYISGWISNTGIHAGRPKPIYSAGSRPDVEFVPLNIRATKISAAERREQVIKLLTESKLSKADLAEKMHISGAGVLVYLGQLRKEGKAYIFRYVHPRVANPETRSSTWIPVYAAGWRKDAKRPGKETGKARHARLRKDPEYIESENKRRRLRRELARVSKKPQNIFSALGLP